MLGTLIQSFRHLEQQNPSSISEDIGRATILYQFWRIGGVGGVVGSEYSWLRGCDIPESFHNKKNLMNLTNIYEIQYILSEDMKLTNITISIISHSS